MDPIKTLAWHVLYMYTCTMVVSTGMVFVLMFCAQGSEYYTGHVKEIQSRSVFLYIQVNTVYIGVFFSEFLYYIL